MQIDFEALVFVILAATAIGGALGCVYARKVAHSLLSLMMMFFAVAGVRRCWQRFRFSCTSAP